MKDVPFLKLLKNKNYLMYFISNMVSPIGDNLFNIAITWYMIKKTNSIAPIGIVGGLSLTAKIIFGPFVGVIIDKFSRKKVCIMSDIVRAVLIAALMFFIFADWNIVFVYLTIFTVEFVDLFYRPSVTSILRNIVDEDLIAGAFSLNGFMNYFTAFIGVSLGGVFSQYMNVYVVLVFNASTFIISAFCISLIRMKKDLVRDSCEESKSKNILSSLRGGLIYIRSKKFILQFMFVTFISNIAYTVIYGLIPAIARDVFNSSIIYSILQIGVTLGSSVGLFIIGNMKIKKVGKTSILGSFLAAGFIILFTFTKYPILAIGFISLFGLVDSATIPIFGYNQKQIDDQYRGRVISITNTVILLGSALINYVIATFSSSLNIQVMYYMSAFLLILSGVLGIIFKEIRTAEFK